MSTNGPFQNTDRELWRKTPGDYYSPSIHVTEKGAIGIDVGGFVIVKSVEEWHRLNGAPTPATRRDERLRGIVDAFAGALNRLRESHPQRDEFGSVYARLLEYERIAMSTLRAPEVTEPWTGSWNNWIAPFSACPRCNRSLDWQQGEDVFDNPMVSAKCCGVRFVGVMQWQPESTTTGRQEDVSSNASER